MDFIKFSIANPVKVTVGVLLTILFGILALTAVPIQMTPDVDRPIITIQTPWPGRSPEEVEKSIIMEQEKKLKTLQGLYKMTSTASLGESMIELEFTVGYDISRAVQESSNRLDEVPHYPDDVERPIIRAASSNTDEAIAYGLLTSPDPNFEMAEFYDYADRYVKPVFERIKGLAQVDVYGGRKHEVQVRYDPKVLAQKGISVSELRDALIGDNLNESAGDFANGRQDIRFRVLGRFDSLEPIRKAIVKYVDGAPIYLEDIASAHLVLRKNTYFNQNKGKTSMSLQFRRDTGANVLAVMKEVNAIIDDINKPDGILARYKNDRYKIRFNLVYSDKIYIDSAIKLVWDNMYAGGLLAVGVLLLFLRSMRPTLIISFAIPISVIGTFVAMYAAGRNINVISLAGLAFAIGMVVDCAVVVLENIDRHMHMGKSVVKAAYDGTQEVWGAVLASTLTTVFVFGPVLTIQEESGQLFYDIALAICASVLISMFVSITVVPCAATYWMREQSQRRQSAFAKLYRSAFGLAPFCGWLTKAFADMMFHLTVRSVPGIWLRVVLISTISITSVGLSYFMMPPASYLPMGNKNNVRCIMQTPPGYSLQQNTLIVRRLEESLRPYWEAKDIEEASQLAQSQKLVDERTGREVKVVPPILELWASVRPQGFILIVTSKSSEVVKPLEILFGRAMNSIPGCRGMGEQASIFGRRGGGSNSVQIEVIGADMNRLRDSASYLEQKLVEAFKRSGVRSSPSNYNMSGPEWQIIVDQVRAKELGINVQSMAYTARSMLDGIVIGDFDYEGDNIDLSIIRDPDIPLTPDEFETLPVSIKDSDGQKQIIPIGQLVTFVRADASQQIRRVEQERAIQLMVNPPPEIALETAQARVMQFVEEARQEGGVTPDVFVRLTGNADKLSQARTALLGKWTGWNLESLLSLLCSRFFLALLITYLLMAGLFESFIYPFVIMFSVPFAMVGGFAGLAYVHAINPSQQLDTVTMLGFVILIGVVVNNAILLIAQAVNFMQGFGESQQDIIEKMDYRTAICESVRTRTRPIFMTMSAAIFGMLPLVLSPGAGSELYQGLGGVVVGGLACSTLFTLFVVPLMFCLTIDIQDGIAWLLGKTTVPLPPTEGLISSG